jgi:hypothetical protein
MPRYALYMRNLCVKDATLCEIVASPFCQTRVRFDMLTENVQDVQTASRVRYDKNGGVPGQMECGPLMAVI